MIWRLWHAIQRQIDIRMLWPAILDGADGNRQTALTAFRVHMQLDEAYRGMSEDEKQAFLRNLP